MLQLFSLLALAISCHALQHPMEDPKLFEGDMVLEPDQMWDIENGVNVNPNIPLAATRSSHWPKTIPYSYTDEIKNSRYAVRAIQAAIADYHKLTCLKFVPRTTEKEYLHFYKGSGCSSHVGHYKNRVNWVSLANGCWYKGIVIHEIAHSLGFYHEQSRPDRDHYVRILFENISPSKRYNFRKHGSNIDSMNVPYDYLSVMHYGRTAFGSGKTTIETLDKTKQYLIGQRGGLSQLDILQMNLLYKCPGVTKPPPGTLPPLPTTPPVTVTTHYDTPFIIRHAGKLCASVRSSNRLQLDTACNEKFILTSENKLKHQKTNKCVVPVFIRNGASLKLTECSSTSAQFKQTAGSSIQHVSSGKCIHPYGGSSNPRNNTLLVIYSGCDQYRLSFKLEYAGFRIQHWGELCISVNPTTNRLYLTKACDERFALTSSKSLRHLKTGKCVVPESTKNDAFLKLESDCTSSHFEQTAKFSTKHLETGKCFHPYRGRLRPADGTRVVIYSGCDQNRLQFRFVS